MEYSHSYYINTNFEGKFPFLIKNCKSSCEVCFDDKHFSATMVTTCWGNCSLPLSSWLANCCRAEWRVWLESSRCSSNCSSSDHNLWSDDWTRLPQIAGSCVREENEMCTKSCRECAYMELILLDLTFRAFFHGGIFSNGRCSPNLFPLPSALDKLVADGSTMFQL